ncbi:hypothetical protein RIF29_21784 [Crotalaria pallida]|uniref:Uncharacterized protein n=1 Tax=Crotalaria pallida TaxID=3830 RepID=A0AAN9F806_CROPI
MSEKENGNATGKKVSGLFSLVINPISINSVIALCCWSDSIPFDSIQFNSIHNNKNKGSDQRSKRSE